MKRAKTVVVILVIIAAVVIFWQNREEVETKLIFATVAMPRAMLLTITLGVGFVLGAMTVFRRRK